MGTVDLLSHTTALSGVPRDRLEALARAAVQQTYPRGAILWRAGDVPQNFVVVQRGLVKLVRHANRARAICGLFGPTESLGDLSAIRGLPYPADAIAASESVSVVCLPRQLVMQVFADDPKLFMSLACAIEEKVEALLDKIDVLSAGSVEARLATLLLKLNARFGDDFDDGTSEIPVALSRRDLAELVATSFETAIRVMSRWEREGVLSTTRRGFTLRDVSKLATVSGTVTALAAE
ncbi:MAG TPA: Crp/Fnr family transcriptional regulator [Polyangiaceae bacterium]|nr:Crp/Fnr family transcriptional regulator [Polyangiaceae bacterium]